MRKIKKETSKDLVKTMLAAFVSIVGIWIFSSLLMMAIKWISESLSLGFRVPDLTNKFVIILFTIIIVVTELLLVYGHRQGNVKVRQAKIKVPIKDNGIKFKNVKIPGPNMIVFIDGLEQEKSSMLESDFVSLLELRHRVPLSIYIPEPNENIKRKKKKREGNNEIVFNKKQMIKLGFFEEYNLLIEEYYCEAINLGIISPDKKLE